MTLKCQSHCKCNEQVKLNVQYHHVHRCVALSHWLPGTGTNYPYHQTMTCPIPQHPAPPKLLIPNPFTSSLGRYQTGNNSNLLPLSTFSSSSLISFSLLYSFFKFLHLFFTPGCSRKQKKRV